MSQENVEIVRRAFAGFFESGVDGLIPFYTEDAIIYSIPEWPDDPEYHGHDGWKLDRQWRENFDDFGFDLRELIQRRSRSAWARSRVASSTGTHA